MKPRTKLQFEVLEHSQFLFNRERELLPWAIKECLEHIGYATKKRVACMDCGHAFPSNLIKRKRAICPMCYTKLRIEYSLKTTLKQLEYFAIAEIYGEFQVIRNFELSSSSKLGLSTNYNCREILQHWIRTDGKREVIALNHTLSSYVDSWNGTMEVRNKSNLRSYDVYPYKIHPDSEFRKEYQLYGINHTLKGITFLEAINNIPNSPYLETLLKAKQYNLLGYFCSRGFRSNYWNSIKICIRNRYIVKDVQLYVDYLDLLYWHKKDLRNAHYVCPKNLKQVHDILVAKKRKHFEKQEAERKRIKSLEDDAKFRKLKQCFFGIAFTDSKNEIQVRVLESVQEYMEEGDILKHCVFTNEYYLKADSLILSASVNNTKIETVEVSLKEFKVVQCRGKANSNTEYHDRIIALVNKNMKLIKQRLSHNIKTA